MHSSKSWHAASTANTARQLSSQQSNRLAVRSWQEILVDASAHQQWVMQHHGNHGRMSEAGEDEDWGKLTLQLPKGARPGVDQLLQQLPEALADTVDMWTVSQVFFML